ncbi:MAG: PD-(D/E)XK nuclease family protein [Bacteroidales bacterium]
MQLEKLLQTIRKIDIRGESEFNPLDTNFGRLENTHSDILAKLFEPKWGLWDILVELLKKEGIVDLTHISKEAKIIREKHKIDILITDGKTAIIIENKINAPDQAKQLITYFEKTSKQFEHIIVIYLTLFGHSPSNDSKADLDVKLISYQYHILNWLEKWHKENLNNSNIDDNLKLFVKLYIEQIRRMTNNNKYTMEILENIFGGDNDGYAKEAITLYKAMNSGINLLQIESIKSRIMEIIRDIVSTDYANGNVTEWYSNKENTCWQFDDEEEENGGISFFISGSEIYAQRDNEGVIGDEIRCNNLNNNQYLQDLLIGNKEGIKQWLRSIYGN